MASQKYTSLAASTLGSGYTAGATSIALATGGGALFPSAGDFVIAIGSPTVFLLKCTARATDTLTVEAAAVDGTTAVNASTGAAVTLVISASVLDGIRSSMGGLGTRANLPATTEAHAGDRYRTTNGLYEYVYNGSAWVAFALGFPVTEPDSSLFAWRNQGGAAVSATRGGAALTVPASASDNHRIREIAVPTAPYILTAAMIPHFKSSNFAFAGLYLVESGSGKLITLGVASDNGLTNGTRAIQCTKWTNVTTFSAHYQSQLWNLSAALVWLQIEDNNTNRIVRYSMDGFNWIQLHSVSRTDFITPDKIGFGGNSINSEVVYANLLHWLAE